MHSPRRIVYTQLLSYDYIYLFSTHLTPPTLRTSSALCAGDWVNAKREKECQNVSAQKPLAVFLKDFSLILMFLKKIWKKNTSQRLASMGICSIHATLKTGKFVCCCISIHCPTSGNLDSQMHHHFPGVRTTGVNSRIQRPNWTANGTQKWRFAKGLSFQLWGFNL